ncbi:MAG TPA: retropepsin-like aspartic protease, partial [Phototrophicaceae bacterium]|nr:retropepsin-like aspartic protease [Phototrophicaceae bacterium]
MAQYYRLRTVILAVGCLLMHSGSPHAQECRINLQASLPITFNGFVPTVPAFINGQPVNIGIDTGAQGSMVTPEAVRDLHLPNDPRHFTHAVGAGSALTAQNVIIYSMEFAGVKYLNKSMPSISLARQPSPEEIKIFGTPSIMIGLIGMDILSNYDLEFDVPKRTLTLYKVTGCTAIIPQWKGKYSTVPATLTPSRRIAIPIELDGHPLRAIFDTGSSSIALALSSMTGIGVTADMLSHDPKYASASIGGHT